MRKFTDKIKEYYVNFMAFYERWEPPFTVSLIILLLTLALIVLLVLDIIV